MNRNNIVWSSVIATVFSLLAIITAGSGRDSLSLALGLTAVTSAVLASREK